MISAERRSDAGRTWVAVCEGRRYVCTQRGSSTATTPDCQGGTSNGAIPFAPQHREGAAPAGSAEVRRGYDEARHAHGVTGRFGLPYGMTVTIYGVPAVALGTVFVTLQGPPTSAEARGCQRLEVLIHGQPFASQRNTLTTLPDGRINMAAEFAFDVFQPLAERFPVFGVRACGTSLAFEPEQVEQLRALLAVYSDIARKVEAESDDAIPTAPGQTAL